MTESSNSENALKKLSFILTASYIHNDKLHVFDHVGSSLMLTGLIEIFINFVDATMKKYNEKVKEKDYTFTSNPYYTKVYFKIINILKYTSTHLPSIYMIGLGYIFAYKLKR